MIKVVKEKAINEADMNSLLLLIVFINSSVFQYGIEEGNAMGLRAIFSRCSLKNLQTLGVYGNIEYTVTYAYINISFTLRSAHESDR